MNENMKISPEDKETMMFELGIISGVACGVEDYESVAICESVEVIKQIIAQY